MKRIISIMLAALMALTLAACTAADPTPANTPTEAPATTEAPSVTEAPAETEVPDGLDPEAAALAAFFEKADENGVKNGDKLFDAYDPADPESWHGSIAGDALPWYVDMYAGTPAVKWDGDGHVTEINILPKTDCIEEIAPDEFAIVELAGELVLDGFPELTSVVSAIACFDSIRIDNCPKLEKLWIADVSGPVAVNAPQLYSAELFSHSSVECTYKLHRDSEANELSLTAGEHGSVGFACNSSSMEYTDLRAECDEGYEFVGWFGENGEFFSDNAGICVPDEISGSRIVLRAEFAEIENPYHMFEGTLPTPSDTVIEVKENEPLKIDLDCDGVPESVALNVTPLDEEGFESRMDLTVRLGSDPDKAYKLNDNMIDSYRLYVIDCDTEDDRLDLLLIYGYYEDTVVRAIRVNEAGDGFDFFDAPAYFDFGSIKEGPLDISEGIPMLVGTDLFNTQELDARAIITSEGFRFIGSFSYRDLYDEYFPEPRTLKRELEVEKDGETLTLPAGTGFRPVETDNWTCVVLELEDGSLVTANIENRGYRYYINGLRQDEYCDIFYAG